jgi:DNA polymerase epsilon subunit 4
LKELNVSCTNLSFKVSNISYFLATETTESTTAKKKPTQDRLTNLPIAKIKHIIKLDPDVKLVNAEAVFLVTKTTELFIKSLAKEAFGYAAQNKKKTISKNHVESALTMLPVEL